MRSLPKLFFRLFFVSLSFGLTAQELESQVVVNADLVDQTNRQIFETLEQSLNEFINSRSWTQRDFLPQERIKCSFVLTLTSYKGQDFR